MDKLPELKKESEALYAELNALNEKHLQVQSSLAAVHGRIQIADRAAAALIETSSPSEDEYLLTNEINELYHRASRNLDKKHKAEPHLAELYAKREELRKTRLDPEQCPGGKRHWEPPTEKRGDE